MAGHQFWDLSQLDPAELDDGTERLLGSTLDDVYLAVDAALGRVVAALPEGTDLLIVSPVGMDVNTSRADLLPEMLRAILDPEHHEPDEAPSGSIWRLRAAVPSGLRAKVAGLLPEKVALDLTARLEVRGLDWSRTRAFAHPAENQGYIRLNLRGRERDGIVDPADAPALMDELAAGIASFTDLDGRPAVRSVDRVADRFGTGDRAHQLPDLIVHWTDTPATQLEGLRSERYGTVRRHGVGSGRSGNHTEGDAWAIVVPGTSSLASLGAAAAPRGHRRHRARPRRRRPDGHRRRAAAGPRSLSISSTTPAAVATCAAATSAPTAGPCRTPRARSRP